MYIDQHLWQQLLITVFNSKEGFCLFIEPHSADFSTEVSSTGGSPPIGEGQGSTLAYGLIERTSSMLAKIESKTVHEDEVINRGKRSKTLSEVKRVKNISKYLQTFLEISPVEKEVLLSHKLQDHAYEC